jgi:DNA-binding transcriptional ArsR family regulator
VRAIGREASSDGVEVLSEDEVVQPRVRIGYGTAFDVVIAAAAVADPIWRDTFAAGPETHVHVQVVAGDDFVRRVAAFGRYGWINLIGLMGSGEGPWDLGRLIAAVRSREPEDLHLIMLGGERRQLLDVVDEQTLRRALRGERRARTRLAAALTSDDLVIEVTPWLLETTSPAVQLAVVEILQTWQEQLLPPESEASLASALREHAAAAERIRATSPGRGYLEAVVGGLHYDPAGLDRVTSISTIQVAPIIIVVDGPTETVIVHPPPADRQRGLDGTQRLLELGRALGDKSRMELLTMLQGGERTAVELARQMRAPRTTLLHHLAILRAAGLVHVTVTPGGATLYRLRPEGFTELSSAARGFLQAP